jgi:hypothetical protein
VLSTKSLVELTKLLPADVGGLKKVYGIGPGKSKRYGPEILEIIHAYCLEQGVESTQMTLAPPPKPKPPKVNTKQLSYELFKAGKSIDEVAQERGLTRSTIEGHLTHFIAMGELDLLDALEEEKWMPISQYFAEQGLSDRLVRSQSRPGRRFHLRRNQDGAESSCSSTKGRATVTTEA